MPDFLTFPHAETAVGNTCFTCQTHKHERGFVYLNVRVHPHGGIYLCAGCADQVGRAVGGIDPVHSARKDAALEELSVANEELVSALEREKANKFVPLAEVIDFFAEREKRRPDEPAPTTKKAS